MCEHLLFLLVLLAVTFKCQESSCPIREDQSSHGEKRQYWLQFLTRLLFVHASTGAPRQLPAHRGQSQASLSGLPGDKDPSTITGRSVQGLKHWPWELCHEPSLGNNTRHLNQFPHTPAYVQWQEMGKVNVTSEMLNTFLCRFLAVLPTLFWSGSVLLAATSIILSWNTSQAHISELLTHRQSWMLSTSCAEQTGGFYTPASSLQTNKKKLNGGYRLLTVCPQNKENLIIKFKCNTKSKFYCKHLTLFSQDLPSYVWKSIAPNRFFALSFTQNPSLSRDGIFCSLTELIHLTSSNNSVREEGGSKTKTKPKTQHKPYLFPWKKTNPPDVILEWKSGKSIGK